MPAIIVWSINEWIIAQAARRVGCKAVIVRDGSQLKADNEAWTIGEKELPNCTEWNDLGTHTVISGGEVLELGPHKNDNDDLPF